MDKFNEIHKLITTNPLFNSLVIVIICIIFYIIAPGVMKRIELRNGSTKAVRRGRTYAHLISSLLKYVFLTIAIILVLQANGVNVDSMLAGIGIMGAIIGLAAQDFMKDIIRGITIISDDYFAVGDLVKYGDGDDNEGRVLSIGIRTTKVKNIINGRIISVSNRNIEKAEILPARTSITLPLPYELKVAESDKIMTDIAAKIATDENITECNYLGITSLGDSAINHLLVIVCLPEARLAARRSAYRTALLELERAGISVPYPQMDVHSKK
ncbi:mechanosensitive ion channel family protein [Candidatus Saccharibacteria bacterium]|nr:mechanosensitive ion channel family protein [Candidatus Saccharibacteria bacterium]